MLTQSVQKMFWSDYWITKFSIADQLWGESKQNITFKKWATTTENV